MLIFLKLLVGYLKFTFYWRPALYPTTLLPSFPVSYAPFPTCAAHTNGCHLHLGLRVCAGGPRTKMEGDITGSKARLPTAEILLML